MAEAVRLRFAELETADALKELVLPDLLKVGLLAAIYVSAVWVQCSTKSILINYWAGDEKRAAR